MLSADDILASSDRLDRQASTLLQAIEDEDARDFLIQRDDLAHDLNHHLTEIVKFVGSQLAARVYGRR